MSVTPHGADVPTFDFDSMFYDRLFKLRNYFGAEGQETPEVAHVDIDDATLELLETNWPLTRADQAKGFQILADLGAKNVVYDIEYQDSAPGRVSGSDIENLYNKSLAAFESVLKVVQTEDSTLAHKFEIRSQREEMRKAITGLVPNDDVVLAKALAMTHATIGVHSVNGTPLEVTEEFKDHWYKKFEISLLSFGNKVDEKKLNLVRKLRHRYFVEELLPKMNFNLPWWAKKDDQHSLLVKRWPELDSLAGEQLLDEWVGDYNLEVANHWVRLSDSIPASVTNNEAIVPPFLGLMMEWSEDEVATGLVNARADEDGIMRRVSLFRDVGQRRHLQLALRGYLVFKNLSLKDVVFNEDHILLGEHKVPLEDGNWLRLNWKNRSATERAKKRVSFLHLHNLHTHYELGMQALAKASMAEDNWKEVWNNGEVFELSVPAVIERAKKYQKIAKEKRSESFYVEALEHFEQWVPLEVSLRKAVQGKIVFVGLAATSSTDRRATPLKADVDMVDLQATVAANLIEGHFVQRVNGFYQFIFITLLMWAMSWISLRSEFRGGALTWAASIFLIFVIAYSLFAVNGLLMRGLTMCLGSSMLFVTVTGVKQLWDFQIRTTVSRTLSPNLVDFIMEHPKKWEELRAGKSLRLTVLFSDIKGFTKFCEGQAPAVVKQRMNQIMDKLSPCVLEEGGTVDKFMGDCVMAFFGAPIETEDHALKAIRAATNMRQALNDLVEEFKKEGLHELDMGIGISTGPMTIGNFGSSEVEDFSIIGDSVNLGSRIEGLTRTVEADILISEETYNDAKDFIESEYRGEHQVKGKSYAVKLWEVCGLKEEAKDD
jgi:class 3 adenylate cyclase/CHASE2 domain-containing sensor protein